ncbi:S26 family signal peptidase [Phycisphaerales bacterium AB-hyl4]|uniref:Signal peptidase I n=1 Tax=Natronomicrosphaera hydrolytica TaxID=3242702 RepID=A0ABV4U012_9BACT
MSKPATPTTQHTPRRRGEESIKETFEAIAIAFILAFVFRAFVVEAFVIPTGSMAPTLLGQHLRVPCQQCGHRFATDVPDRRGEQRTAIPLRSRTGITCPMCRFTNHLPQGTRPSSGDRILVQKYIYNVRSPQRWDVAVFKNPQQPEVNFIKRLVGLPNEAVHLFEGNVYTAPLDDSGNPVESGWRIARKSDRPDVQRAVWQPIYHSQYIPLDEGDPARNQLRDRRWRTPWVAEGPRQDAWQIDNRRSYRFDSDRDGRVRFDFSRGGDDETAGLYPYNQHRAWIDPEPMEDIRLAVGVEPDQAGLRIALTTTARLHDGQHQDTELGAEQLTATLDETGELRLTAGDLETGEIRAELDRVQVRPLRPGRTTRLELWYVDQEASVWIDGRRVLQRRFDPPMDVLRERPGPLDRPETLHISVAGSPVTLHQVELDRDLYYSTLSGADQRRARGAMVRLGDRVAGWRRPLIIRDNEYFPVGDNGPQSDDGRFWQHVDETIAEQYFADRLADGEDAAGLVPEELMMGRAFFVYFPAPYPWQAGGRQIVPNFGDMRMIR